MYPVPVPDCLTVCPGYGCAVVVAPVRVAACWLPGILDFFRHCYKHYLMMMCLMMMMMMMMMMCLLSHKNKENRLTEERCTTSS